ncbi:MAG: hypothetical protein SFY69_02540 [Planctomycetota bacterium]|nr:hypothetical protein [Planctomycetota bacterium]
MTTNNTNGATDMPGREGVSKGALLPARLGARTLRSLAGGTGGWRRGKRGSFLVMVVGTLALLSLFAILFVSIGSQDVRTRAAVVKRAQLEDVPSVVSDYIARDIVGRDVVARWYETNTANSGTPSRPVGRREATDYPSVDWNRRSDSLNVNLFFDPVGSMDPPDAFATSLTGNYAPKGLPTDPWLASSEPVWLNFSGAPAPANQPAYIRRRDWAHITNIAPDGRFVNLFNLRNNFDALPGAGNDPAGLPRMSEGLSLFDAEGAPTFVTDFGVNVNNVAARNTPAFWTARQRGAFRPVSISSDPPATNAQYPLYQWADADGDGMLDSRWFELSDRRATDDELLRLLPEDGTYRYFVAARIVDLSANVNVNTAADLVASGTQAAPAGASPADIDLRRLLSLKDRLDEDASVTNPPPGGYDGMYQIGAAAAPENYGAYDADRAFGAAQYGYEALRLGVEARYTPPEFAADGATRYSAPNGDLPRFASDFNVQPATFLADLKANPNVRRFVYARQTNNYLGTYVDLATTDAFSFTGLFGGADLEELLTFRTINDARATSPLELTLGARDDTVPPTDPNGSSLRYSALRDNRSFSVEAARLFVLSTELEGSAYVHAAADVRQRLTTVSGARELRNRSGASADALASADLKLDFPALVAGGNGGSLFAGYADALAADAKAGVWNATDAPESQTLFYGGRGPELAVRVAAHMAANAADAFDPGTSPREFTLVLDRTFEDIKAIDAERADDERLYAPSHEGGEMNIGTARLANSQQNASDEPVAPAINVFGVEPQPFLTQVTTFTVYVDAPDSAGGDDEEGDGNPLITINGTISPTNADFLYRVVAFQLTNPFSEAVTLSGDAFPDAGLFRATDPAYPPLDRDTGFYYIEFGGKYFKLASMRDQVYIDTATAGENQSNNVPSIGDDARIGEFVDAPPTQLPLTISPLSIPAGKTITVYTLSQVQRRILSDRLVPVDSQLQGTPQEKLRTTIERAIENNLDTDTDIVGVHEIPEFDPATGDLVLVGAGADVNPLPAAVSVANLYRVVRRGPSDENGEGRRVNTSIPARYWDNVTGPATTSHEMYAEVNKPENDRLMDRLRLSGASLNRTIPAGQQDVQGTDSTDSNDQNGFTIALWASVRRPSNPVTPVPLGALPAYCLEPKSFAGWNVAATDAASPGALSRTDFTTYEGGGTTPRIWRINMSNAGSLPGNTAGTHPGSISGSAVGTAPRTNPLVPTTSSYAANYPELTMPNGQYGAALRIADTLLPWGVGPCEMPLDLDGDDVTDPELRWTTLSEAMAAALGYQTTFATGDPLVLFAPEPDPTNPGFLRPVLDRGHLVLDRYTPFFDADSNGVFDPAPTGNDERRGLEIPAAMAVLDVFTVPQYAAEGLTRARIGTVNINTASPTVVRCLPLVSPPPPTDPLGVPWWWGASSGLTQASDIGATIVAYRDKIDQAVRAQSLPGAPPVITFADTNGGNPAPPTTAYEELNGRATWTEITAIGEQRGFRSLGELLAVRFRDGTPGGNAMPSNIDFLGFNGANSSRIGMDPVYHNGPSGVAIDALTDEYKERLTIVNALANTVSTRSDVYAVWFVLHGYKRADVENLAPTEPLVPSVQRRFLMVLDRSNVTSRGQKANVLLFREVPVSAR